MTDKKNIEDVTNSPKDWEDFWHSPEKYGTWETTNDKNEELVEIPPYVEAILGLTDYPADCKRESPLSE
jgi:hypothetical protein